nr:NADH dehydrogenase subunit 2, mitochondrial [Tanacetum cinerariifolium]
ACGEERPTTNEGGKLALLAVDLFLGLVRSVSYCCRLEKARGKEDLHSFHSFSARGEARPTTNEGGKLALLAVALFLGLVRSGKGRKERWSLLLGTWLVHSLAHELAALPEAMKGGLGPGRGEWPNFREEKRGIRQRRKANRAKLLWPFREVQLYHMIGEERWKKRLGMNLGVFVRAVCGKSRTYGNEGVCVYTCGVVVGPTHPICSMIYGSTGATHFDQLAKILTGYEITGARSSGIFMGILSITVGSLFKITAVPFRASVGWTTAYRW